MADVKIGTADYVLACQAGDLRAAAQALIDMGQRPVLLRTDNTGSCKVPFDDGAWGRRLVAKRMETLERSIKRGLLGLGLGFQPTGNLAVLDLDCPDKDRDRLPEVLAGAVELLFGGEVPETFEVHGKGGSHLWFTISDNLRDKWAEMGLGKKKIELAGGGAVEVFMPTPDGQGQYQVATAPSAGKSIGAIRPIQPMPASLEEYLIKAYCSVTGSVEAAGLFKAGITSAARERFFEATIRQAITKISNAPKGTQHDTVRNWGMMLAGYAVSLGQVHRRVECHEEAMRAAKAAGASENRASRTWDDGWEYGLNKPAPLDHTKIAEYESARVEPIHIRTGKNKVIRRGANRAENSAGEAFEERVDNQDVEGSLGSCEGAGGLEEALSVLRALANTLRADKQIWWHVKQAVASKYGQEIADQVVESLRAELAIEHPEKGDKDKAGHKWTWKRFVKEARENGYKPEDGAASLDPADMADYILGQIDLAGRLVFYRGLPYVYSGGRYLDDAATGKDYLSNLVTNLATPVFRRAEMYLTPKEVAAIIMHLKALADITDRVTGLNGWIDQRDTDPDPADIIPVANGLVIATGTRKPRLIPHSDRWFCLNCGEAAYDPKAAPPRHYMNLLNEIYEGDRDAIKLEIEMLGVTVGRDSRKFQKIFVLYGEMRCGKGERMDLYARLVGGAKALNVCDVVKGNLQHVIGQPMIVIDEPDIDAMTKTDGLAVTSFLKGVTGGSEVSISVKYAGNYSGQLAAQIWVTTNPMFTGRDSTGAFASRLIGNIHGRSWLDKEDLTLKSKLQSPAEMSGVLRLALIGLRRARRLGRFTATDGTARMQEACRGSGSSFLEWMSAAIEVTGDKGEGHTIEELYESYAEYCNKVGSGAKKRAGLKAELLQVKGIKYDTTKIVRIRSRDKPGRYFRGIRIRPIESESGVVEFQRIAGRYGTNFRRN